MCYLSNIIRSSSNIRSRVSKRDRVRKGRTCCLYRGRLRKSRMLRSNSRLSKKNACTSRKKSREWKIRNIAEDWGNKSEMGIKRLRKSNVTYITWKRNRSVQKDLLPKRNNIWSLILIKLAKLPLKYRNLIMKYQCYLISLTNLKTKTLSSLKKMLGSENNFKNYVFKNIKWPTKSLRW
jgi:hypothetical protein